MTGPQVDDADEGGAGADGGPSESEIVGDHDAALVGRAIEDVNVWSPDQLLVPGGSNIAAALLQTGDHLGTDVLVGQERETQGLHAGMLRSQVRSPLSASAA